MSWARWLGHALLCGCCRQGVGALMWNSLRETKGKPISFCGMSSLDTAAPSIYPASITFAFISLSALVLFFFLSWYLRRIDCLYFFLLSSSPFSILWSFPIDINNSKSDFHLSKLTFLLLWKIYFVGSSVLRGFVSYISLVTSININCRNLSDLTYLKT